MTGRVSSIWRHPIKAHGREALQSVVLSENATIPWDREWAVTHEGTRLSGPGWARCGNFSRAAKAPALMALTSRLDEACGDVTLSHPDRPDLTIDPDTQAQTFVDWIAPLMPEDRARSTGIVRATDRGMTDSNFASISLNNAATHAAIEQKLGTSLSQERWRGNIWIDGLDAWDEVNWLGKTVRIGDVEFDVREQITRCLATTANPDTGKRDVDTLGALEAFGHQEFGVYGVVTKAGTMSVGDQVEVF